MKQFRVWVGVLAGAVVLLVAALVVLDLLGARRLIPLTVHYDWLAFIGALVGGIVGGLFTFGGVYLTLQQQRRSDRERREADDLKTRLSIMPLFEFAISYDKADFDNSQGQIAGEVMPSYTLDGGKRNDPDSFEFLYDIVIRNVGLGHGLVMNVVLDFFDNKHAFIEAQNRTFVNFLVKQGARRDLRHFIYAPRNSARFADPRQYSYMIEVRITYEDLLGNQYEQLVRTSINKGLYADEDPETGGKPFAQFHTAEPPVYLGQKQSTT